MAVIEVHPFIVIFLMVGTFLSLLSWRLMKYDLYCHFSLGWYIPKFVELDLSEAHPLLSFLSWLVHS